ncbi:FAD:protein FMN transferase [Paracoccus salsus]|uniref:FAD:protein FMN transferase n=1 Tax=Paracoccus salsus TaxID=2911061 RepID=UPI001F3396E7|nr:FAD:protein FMN transferase [Paracoccus salsus]MCF3973545.1 FAD:protein FMN transferase [Paracoccus salsus]
MSLTRRRFLTLSAAALALPSGARAQSVARWQGVALGAPATMILAGVTPIAARPVFAAIEAELLRLERIFSLYRDDSALVRLNRDGHIATPPPELLEVLTLAGTLHAATAGAFDPTVQPLWQALATGSDTARARAAIGWGQVGFDTSRVTLARPGMGLTLNGIAQGYITDRIADLLAARGFVDVLVDMGEIAARGQRGDGTGWRAGVATPEGLITQRVTLRDRALATSAPLGTQLAGGVAHILGSGGRVPTRRLVSVSAPRAALADGLSTALCLLDTDETAHALARFQEARLEATL